MTKGQIKQLIEIAQLPNVKIQVLPLSTSDVPIQGSFRILEFADADLRDVVYVQQLTSALYLDRDQEVDVYRKVMARLSTRALTQEQTTSFLRELLLVLRA